MKIMKQTVSWAKIMNSHPWHALKWAPVELGLQRFRVKTPSAVHTKVVADTKSEQNNPGQRLGLAVESVKTSIRHPNPPMPADLP